MFSTLCSQKCQGSEIMNISDAHLDYIKEVFNIGVGKGAKILNAMLQTHITLNVPEISVLENTDDIKLSEENTSLATVNLPFNGPLNGHCKLIFPTDSALKLVKEISGEEKILIEDDFDAITEGVLKEIGNIVLNSVIGVLCNYLEIQLKYSVPVFNESMVNDLIRDTFSEDGTVGLLARIHFLIESMDVQGDVMTVFKMGSFSQLLKLIDEKTNE